MTLAVSPTKAIDSAIEFNNASGVSAPPRGPFVTFAIRTDALHATDLLIQGLANYRHVSGGDVNASAVVKDAYKEWGRSVLASFASCLDYTQYGLTNDAQKLSVHFYDAPELTVKTINNARAMASNPMLISLDDIISNNSAQEKFPEIAFSRLFSLDGAQELDYIARPGHQPVEVQIAAICEHLKADFEKTGKRTPIVLLEDNVRRAKMLNWVIDLMHKQGVFQYGEMAGISSSFCNATPEECSKIVFEGKIVPVKAVVECDQDCVVDVATTRDLLFDGFVTEHNGVAGRLPGIFMDVSKRFKIAPEHADRFRQEIISANIHFCKDIQNGFGVNPPLAWFDGGNIISRIMGCDLDTPMADIMARAGHAITHAANSNNRPAAATCVAR